MLMVLLARLLPEEDMSYHCLRQLSQEQVMNLINLASAGPVFVLLSVASPGCYHIHVHIVFYTCTHSVLYMYT